MDILTPTVGVDPRTALATSIHAAPGVYAVLVGSGMSSAAGIPTGWQVLQDLIRRVALCEGADDSDLGDTPDGWWAERFGREPRYDELVGSLAKTDAARQALLRGYFDPLPSAGGPISPTNGHRALAALCASGRVRVLLSTNFDRLLERALEDAGVAAQVIATPDGLEGMTPLAHAPTTVVKLHGDYAGRMRNTPRELAEYPDALRDLVRRVVDEYGLLIVGWSADYDDALAAAISSVPGRRYPTYWTLYGNQPGEVAGRLIAQRQASAVKTAGADEFFVDLAQRIERLDRRAVRRGQPTPLRTHLLTPEQSTTPQGWRVLPLLQLRAAAIVGPASIEDCGSIRPQQRDGLISGLSSAALTASLRRLASVPGSPAVATGPAPESAPESFNEWIVTPDAYQSTDYASYRLGGDGSHGVSSLVTVALPGLSRGGGVTITADIGLSLAKPISLLSVGTLWRDGLVLASALLPEVLAGILPVEAEVDHGEVHMLAASMDGTGLSRPNELGSRIDLSPLGAQARPPGASMGFAMRLAGALSEHEASEVTAQAIDGMALANGYLDPRNAIAALRSELGLTSSVDT